MRFLLNKFSEVQDVTQPPPFPGFRDEDFELQPIVKRRLAAFGESVLNELTDDERERVGGLHVGRRIVDHAWLHTHEGRDVVNLTIELYAERLLVNVVGWKIDQSATFERWLLSDSGQLALRTLGGHDIVIFERRASNFNRRDQGARPFFQTEHTKELASRNAPEVDREWIRSQLEAFGDRRWQKPGIHLRRSWPRNLVIQAGERITGDVAREVKMPLDLLDKINGRS